MPYEAARAMLYGHTWIALTNGLRGSNPFCDACHIAMDYGRESIIKDDWKKIFDDSELDGVIAQHAQDRRRQALSGSAGSSSVSANA